MFESHKELLEDIIPVRLGGKLSSVTGLTMLARGLPATTGSICTVRTRAGHRVYAQVVGFRDGQTVMMPLQDGRGVAAGDNVYS